MAAKPLGFPVGKKIRRAYAIVDRDSGLLFERTDSEFYGAIWIYPSKKIALRHCGPAGKVIPLELRFPGSSRPLIKK
jgi:hypothetical protein